MNLTAGHTHAEIYSQPEAWQSALQAIHPQKGEFRDFFNKGHYAQVIFTGCGSTYYLALAAAALYRQLSGRVATGLPASEIWLYPGSAYPGSARTLLVAISRSGETTETVAACEAFKLSGQGDVLTLSCYPDRALTYLGALNVVLPSGQEQSIAQTRAFTTLYIAVSALIAVWTGKDTLFEELKALPEIGARLLAKYQQIAHDFGSDTRLDRFYFLGSGLFYGLAAELSLKLKEMSMSHSEPFHFMEYRHGPQAMITPETLLIGLHSEAQYARERAVLDDMSKGNVKVLTFGESKSSVSFESRLSEPARGALYLPIGQLLAFERAISRGLNPDRPNNLDYVVRVDKTV
jgi:glucosamine--fructose-6-phosphate aminotransferase (isomerizing)